MADPIVTFADIERAERRAALEAERAEQVAHLDEVRERPGQYVQARIAEIDAHLARVPHRLPTHPGNVTMRTHLQNQRHAWTREVRKGGLVDAMKERAQARIAAIDAELAADGG